MKLPKPKNPQSLPYFCDNNSIIFNDNILQTRQIKTESIDLIITSPPYNVDINYASNADDLAYEDYLEFSRKWMSKCYEFTKPDGRFCLNIPLDKNKGGQQSVCADLTRFISKSR